MKSRAKLGGLFDWWRKKPSPPPSGQIIYVGPGGEARQQLPVVPREPQLPAARPEKASVRERLLSLFKAFDPEEARLPALAERLDILPQESRLPALMEKLEILPESIKPSPPKDLSVSEEGRQMELWSTLFEETREGEGALFEELPRGREPEPSPYPPGYYRPPHEDWPRGEPPLYWRTHWRIPSPYDVAYWLKNTKDTWDLNGIFEYTLVETDSPSWHRKVKESPHTGEPAELMIEQVAHWNSAYEDLANLLQIPQQVIDIYFGEIVTEEEGFEQAWLFEQEVLAPYLERVSKAFEALRPVELRGWYEISTDDDFSWSLKYMETMFRS